jgi:protein-disulfide isomerase
MVCALVGALAGCAAAGSPPGEVEGSAVAYREGQGDAPVHVIYFTDYVCDDCARFSADAVEPLRTEWVGKGRARLTIVDLAWHRGSVDGAAAASCAAAQGKFWPMHTLLFQRQETWKRAIVIPAALSGYAAELELDTAAFNACAARDEHGDRVDAAEKETRRFGVRGTPAFVVNGRLYYGSQAWPWVEQVLLAHERGTPEAAPPPPFKIPTKRVVDSVKLKELEDSVARARGRAVN